MLFMPDNLVYLCSGLIVLAVCLIACAVYAYYVNAQRPADDPQKRNYRKGSIILVPFTWPPLLLASLMLFILWVFVYTTGLILFTVAFLVIRKPFWLVWLEKIAVKVGNKLLQANTLLLSIVFGRKTENTQTSASEG